MADIEAIGARLRLQLHSVAEGIEHAEQAVHLAALGAAGHVHGRRRVLLPAATAVEAAAATRAC